MYMSQAIWGKSNESYPVRSRQRRGCNTAYDSAVTTNGEKSAEVIVPPRMDEAGRTEPKSG